MMNQIEIPTEFKRLFDDDWREAAVYGGRYSLKSHTVARCLLIRARQSKKRIACFREFQNSINESSYQLLADLIKQYDLSDFELTKNSIINKINGSDFLFKGLWNNEQSIKSTEGIDIAWIEEAQTVSEKSLEVLTPTIRKEGSQIIYTYNRLLEEDPVHKRLVLEGRPNTLIINVNYDIALKYGMMPDVIRLEMEDDRDRRPALYRHKWLGEPYSLERRIYNDWAIIDEIPHEARLERYGLDFGYTNDPTAIVAIYRYNGGFIFDEILYRKGMLNKPIADFMLNQKQALIVADSAEPKSITELNMYGLQVVGAKKGKDSNKFGIATVQQQRCSITKRSVNGIKEYRGYMWQTDVNGKFLQEPEDGNDHCFIGDTLITTNTGLVPISDIKEGCLVLTKSGYRRVRKKWNNGLRLVNKYLLQFDTFGIELICTPDHKVKTGSTWTQISELKSGQMVTLSNSLMEKDTSSILKRDIFLNTLQECMLQFGGFLTDLYQKASRYIIKTETPGITPFQTSRSFLDRNTYQCMQGVGFRKTKNGLSIFKSRESKKLLSGTNPTMEDGGTRYTAKRVGLKENQKNSSANGVALSTKQSTRGSLFTATKTVELKRLDVKESSRQIVYDLTVEQSHEYFANGILVHNCMDAIKYGVKNIIPDDIIPIKQFSGQAILNQLLEEQY